MMIASNYYTTRDGCPFRFYANDGIAPYSIHGAVYNEYEGWQSYTWTPEGRFNIDHETNLDLLPVELL